MKFIDKINQKVEFFLYCSIFERYKCSTVERKYER